MDDLFIKAVDVLGPLQSKALSAIDSTLNEYPKPGDDAVGMAPLNSGVHKDSGEDLGLAPSAVEEAKRVLSFWEDLDLENKKTTWDEQGVVISQNQDTSTKNRKTLADLTRAFKSGDKKDVAPLLKSYQGEIDSLTKRAKYAESTYLGIYQLMYDAPDVVPSLKAFVNMVDRISAAEQEARRYRQELEVRTKEAASAKALHATLRRLEERNAVLEEEMEGSVLAAVEEKKKEIARDLEESLAREAAQQSLLDETRETFAALQRQHDRAQSQLFDLKSKAEEERALKQHELEMSSEEIERAQEQVRSLERARTELIAEVEKLRQGSSEKGLHSDGEPGQTQSLDDLENSLSVKDKFISTLREQVQQLENTLTTEREKTEVSLRSLEEALEEEQDASEALRAELGMRPSIEQLDELRRQNRVLQVLVGTDVDDEWDKPSKDKDAQEESDAARVHRALRDTNRKLMAELTNVKITLAERQTEAEESVAKVVALEEKIGELQALVARLEEDIAKGSGMPGPRDGWNDSPSAITGLLSEPHMANESSAPPGGSARQKDEGTMLEIVCGQRERFRKRVKEMEEETGKLQNSLGKSKAEVQRLKNDNINLYEKIRYLEQYNRQAGSGSVKRVGGPQSGSDVVVFGGEHAGAKGARYACFGVSDPGDFQPPVVAQDVQVSASGGAEMRYRKLYEERMNPFNEFHEKEQERSYRNLRLHDKITLTGGRFLLANKYGRTFVFFYTLLLHILVFFVLYRASHPRTVVLQPLTHSISPLRMNLNHTVPAEQYLGNSTHTFADTLAEQVGTLMQTTRDWTNQGSTVRSSDDLDVGVAVEHATKSEGEQTKEGNSDSEAAGKQLEEAGSTRLAHAAGQLEEGTRKISSETRGRERLSKIVGESAERASRSNDGAGNENSQVTQAVDLRQGTERRATRIGGSGQERTGSGVGPKQIRTPRRAVDEIQGSQLGAVSRERSKTSRVGSEGAVGLKPRLRKLRKSSHTAGLADEETRGTD